MEMRNIIQEESEPFYFDETVDVINPKEERVMDAKIISIRGNIIVVRYTGTKEEENIHLEDNLILKQWRPGRPFRVFNRVDVKSSLNNKWYEGIVIKMEEERVLVRYNKNEEWLERNSKNLASVGKLHTSEEINEYLYRKKKFFKASEVLEQKFREEIKSVSLKIREVQGDGNCLYRAISDQVYGTENYFEVVKSKCMDYLELEIDFFSQFIEGGKDKFEEYIIMKKIDGVWGDDLEIQALSEIYNQPIEIFSHSKEPLKTFHETSVGFSRGYERSGSKGNNLHPIRISYHGQAHYNSLLPMENYQQFNNSLIKSNPGEYENSVLEKVKIKIMQERIKGDVTMPSTSASQNKIPIDEILPAKHEINVSNTNYPSISVEDKTKLEISRGNFKEKRAKDLDVILEQKFHDTFIHTDAPNQNITNINEAIKQSEYFATEEDLLKSVLELSIKETPQYTSSDYDMINNPCIKFIIEMGFTTEEAIVAYSAVGEDPDLMLQYLYSLNIN